MNETEAAQVCEGFAKQHGIFFENNGTCGFGREAVGFLNKDRNSYVDHNPVGEKYDYDVIPEYSCPDAEPPEGVDAYHKHNCLAVLGKGKESIIGLAKWVLKMQEAGKVEIIEYQKDLPDLSSIISGNNTGYTVLIR